MRKRIRRHARAASSGTGVGLLLAGLVTLVQAERSPVLLHSSAPMPVTAEVGTTDPVRLVPVQLPVDPPAEPLPVDPPTVPAAVGQPVPAAAPQEPASPGTAGGDGAGAAGAGSAAPAAVDLPGTGDRAPAATAAESPAGALASTDPAREPAAGDAGGVVAGPQALSPPGATVNAEADSPGPTAPVGRSAPVRIDIAAIGVHAAVMAMGLAPDGTLGVPAPGPHYDDTAWYDQYPAPGELGPAIIAGHLDSAHDGPSVFYRLGALTPGDHVVVTRADGSIVTFTVTGLGRYPQRDFPVDKVYGNTDHAGLRLITCGGDLDPRTHHYLDNIVVFATMSAVSGPGD